VFNCLCGKQFGVNMSWLHFVHSGSNGVGYTAIAVEQQVHLLYILSERDCVVCDTCATMCRRCRVHPDKIFRTMSCCFNCERNDVDVIQNIKAVDQWLKLQKHPF
jgi:hypothetical protein